MSYGSLVDRLGSINFRAFGQKNSKEGFQETNIIFQGDKYDFFFFSKILSFIFH